MNPRLVLAVLLPLLVGISSTDAGEPRRFTARLNSIEPTKGVVFVDETAADGQVELVTVKFRDAEVVRVWRDGQQPTEWRTRPTRLHRWPTGTFLVVVGRTDSDGVVWADRIEIPKADAP